MKKIIYVFMILLIFNSCRSKASFMINDSQQDVIRNHNEIIKKLDRDQKYDERKMEYEVSFFITSLQIKIYENEEAKTRLDLSSYSYNVNNIYRQILLQKMGKEVKGESLRRKSYLTYNLLNILSLALSGSYLTYKNPFCDKNEFLLNLIIGVPAEFLGYYMYGTMDENSIVFKKKFSFSNTPFIILFAAFKAIGLYNNINVSYHNKLCTLGYSFEL